MLNKQPTPPQTTLQSSYTGNFIIGEYIIRKTFIDLSVALFEESLKKLNWPCSKRAGDWVRTYFFLVRTFNID